jgi:hypothetical protein
LFEMLLKAPYQEALFESLSLPFRLSSSYCSIHADHATRCGVQ